VQIQVSAANDAGESKACIPAQIVVPKARRSACRISYRNVTMQNTCRRRLYDDRSMKVFSGGTAMTIGR
jgi:hypothetical protein